MILYALRRIAGAIPTLFVIITLTFFMMRAAPGGPFDSERRLPPEIERNLKAAYDLDKPLVQQYLIYLGKAAQGDFGPSFKNKDFTVAQLIATGLPVSARLGLWAMALALLIGTTLGILAALRQNRWQDYSVMSVAMLGGGVQGGRVIGRSSATGSDLVEAGWSGNRAIYPDDIAATIYSALGIDWTRGIDDTPSGRRYNYINGTGGELSFRPVEEVFG